MYEMFKELLIIAILTHVGYNYSYIIRYAIKYIVGHAVNDLTEEVYTDRSIEWLSTEIEKIRGLVFNEDGSFKCMNVDV